MRTSGSLILLPPLGLFSSLALSNSDVLVLVSSRCILLCYILFHYYSLQAGLFSNEKQKGGGSGWERRWGETGRGKWRKKIARVYYMRKKSISNESRNVLIFKTWNSLLQTLLITLILLFFIQVFWINHTNIYIYKYKFSGFIGGFQSLSNLEYKSLSIVLISYSTCPVQCPAPPTCLINTDFYSTTYSTTYQLFSLYML